MAIDNNSKEYAKRTATTVEDIRRSRMKAISNSSYASDPFAALSKEDLEWAKLSESDTRTSHTYFDYVFSGSDIKVFIEGMVDEANCIPIIEFGFNIEQQKVPVYGFWNHNFSNVMRGTRLVTGALRIATVSTHYMTNKIAEAAASRAAAAGNYTLMRGLDRDEENIKEYWTRNIDPDIAFHDNKYLFSAHPPFNFAVKFLMQSTSVNEPVSSRAQDLYQMYKDKPAEFQDMNERLVETGSDTTMQYIIENVEITSMQTEFSPTGDPIAETYSWFARDLRLPKS